MSVVRYLADLDPKRKWERYLQIVLLICAAAAIWRSGADLQNGWGKLPEEIWEAASLAFIIMGVALRLVAFGFVDENAPSVMLQTSGVYSIVRHPVLMSDALIAAGLMFGTQVWWFIALGAVVLPAYYWLAVRTRDEETARHLGAIVAWWRAETPAFSTDLSRWDSGRTVFLLRTALERALPSMLVSSALALALEVLHDLRVGDATLQSWPQDWEYYFATFTAVLAFAVLVKVRTFHGRSKTA
jgi:protein-S-isoprenylcysteine O-methyltransferase Ste14